MSDGRINPQTQTAEYHLPEGILRLERTGEMVTWERGPVESWTFTDTQGHEHRYDHGYPTLVRVVDEWCHVEHGLFGGADPDGHEAAGHWECLQCHEVIRPATGPGSKFVVTREDWTLEQQVTGAELAEAAKTPGQVRNWTRSRGQAWATVVRHVSRDEVTRLITADQARQREAAQREAAGKAARDLGYPGEFA